MQPSFLVTAVPRSGTTFLTRVLNGHPDLLCGAERFHGPRLSPERLTIEGFETMDRERVSAAMQDALVLTKAPNPNLVIGEKCPRAYLHLDKVLPRFAATGHPLRLLAVVRDVEDVENSWFRRALDKNDNQWDRGQYGFFPFVEMVLLTSQLVGLPPEHPCLVVSYDHIVSPEAQGAIFDAVASFLTVAPHEGMHAVAERERRKTERSATGAGARAAQKAAFVTASPFFGSVLASVRARGVAPLGEVRGEWDAALAALRADRAFFDEVLECAASVHDPAMRRYMCRMEPPYRDALRDLDHRFAEDLTALMRPRWDEDPGGTRAATAPPLAGAPAADGDGPIPPRADGAADGAEAFRAGSSPGVALEARTRHFDITNLVAFLIRTGRLTGIQRVQCDAVLGAAEAEDLGRRCAVYFDPTLGWRTVTMDGIKDLFSAGDGLAERLRTFVAAVADLPPAQFEPDDILYLTGATWDQRGLLSSFRELKSAGVRCVFFLHDILPVQRPEFFTPGHTTLKAQWLRECVALADGIVCNSRETQEAFLAETRFAGPVSVVDLNVWPSFLTSGENGGEAADDSDYWTEEVLSRLDLADRPFALMVGTIEPRKNHLTAIEAWQSLRRSLADRCPTLVVVGAVGWMASSRAVADIIALEGTRRGIVHLAEVDDVQLAALYRRCLFSIQLSRAEGWGLPVTEALASGAVCVVGRNSAARAATQGLVVDVDERSERDISQTIEALVRDEGRLSALRVRVRREARFASWADFARDLTGIEQAFRRRADPQSVWPVIVAGRPYAFGSERGPADSAPDLASLDLQHGSGWHLPDGWGSWTDGREAKLRFRLPASESFHLYAALTISLRHRPTDVRIRADDALIWSGRLLSDRRTIVRGRIEPPADDMPVTVVFECSDALDMSLVEGPDQRVLGLGLIELCVVPSADTQKRLDVLEALTARYVDH